MNRPAVLTCTLALVLAMVPSGLQAQKGKGKGRDKKDAEAKAAATQTQAKPPAPPQQVDCLIYEMAASSGKPGVDPALRPLVKKLKRPPFSSWTTFKLLKNHQKDAVRMKALTLPLTTGSKLSLLYRDQSASQGKKVRLRLTFTLDDKNDKRKLNGTLNLDSGDFSLIGNESDKLPDGSTYIVAVSCRVPAATPAKAAAGAAP